MTKPTNNRRPLIAAAAVVILIASWVWMLTPQNSSDVPQRYFYDLTIGDTFVDDATRMPPITSPSGGEAVVALVYACGNCDNEADRFIAFYEKFTDEYKQAYAEDKAGDTAMPAEVERTGRIISTPDADQWIPMQSDEGVALWDSTLLNRCDDGSQPITCMP